MLKHQKQKKKNKNAAKKAAPPGVELHTGPYCDLCGDRGKELEKIAAAASLARRLGLEVHGGHGLNYANVLPIARISEMVELNIGHSIVARAIMVGMEQAVREMKELLRLARG